MTDTPSRAAEQAVEEFTVRLDSVAGLPPGDRALAYEEALKHLMRHLIDREGWLVEEFSSLALSLGAD